MSQLLLDEQLNTPHLLPVIRKWIKAEKLTVERPGEQILDDRVPSILRTLKQPTFVTIDAGFWNRSLCHADYGILYFDLRVDQQELLPGLLRSLLRLPEFRTRALRMGKVARVSTASISFWDVNHQELQHAAWGKRPRKKR